MTIYEPMLDENELAFIEEAINNMVIVSKNRQLLKRDILYEINRVRNYEKEIEKSMNSVRNEPTIPWNGK